MVNLLTNPVVKLMKLCSDTKIIHEDNPNNIHEDNTQDKFILLNCPFFTQILNQDHQHQSIDQEVSEEQALLAGQPHPGKKVVQELLTLQQAMVEEENFTLKYEPKQTHVDWIRSHTMTHCGID